MKPWAPVPSMHQTCVERGQQRDVAVVQEWCRQKQAECYAVQLPGRNMRKSEKLLDSCQEVAQALLPIVASKLQSVPYMVTFFFCISGLMVHEPPIVKLQLTLVECNISCRDCFRADCMAGESPVWDSQRLV